MGRMELLKPKDYAKRLLDARKVQSGCAKYFYIDIGRAAATKLLKVAALDRIVVENSKWAYKTNPGLIELAGRQVVQYNNMVVSALDDLLKVGVAEARTDPIEMSTDMGDRVDYSNLRPCRDWKTDDKFIYDMKNEKISDLNYNVWKEELCRVDRNLCLGMAHAHCKLDYDPLNLQVRTVTRMTDGNDIVLINQYNPPEWRKTGRTEDTCPEIVTRFFEHLFPDAPTREFVIHWLHNAVMDRNETYLVLNGAKGCGKGIFSSLCESLVGMEHYAKAPTNLLDSAFNGVLLDKRLIVFDEHIINTDDRIAKLKDYINPFQNVEFKNKNALKNVRTHNSYLITNNSVTDMRVEHDDRRFSVVDMTEKNLKDVFPDAEIKKFTDDMANNVDFQVNLGNWIINYGRCGRLDKFYAWKGERFHVLVEASLSAWKKYILELFGSSEKGFEISHTDLKRKFRRDKDSYSMAEINKVEEFLDTYRVGISDENVDGIKIGKLLKSEDLGYYLKSYIGADDDDLPFDDDLPIEEDIL